MILFAYRSTSPMSWMLPGDCYLDYFVIKSFCYIGYQVLSFLLALCAVTVNFYCRCHGCFQVTVTSSGRKFGFTADFSIGVVSPALYCR